MDVPVTLPVPVLKTFDFAEKGLLKNVGTGYTNRYNNFSIDRTRYQVRCFTKLFTPQELLPLYLIF
jgi:hypothetical protein